MTKRASRSAGDPVEFILKRIASVPHLEMLVLLWNCRPAALRCEELATRLYIPADSASEILRNLVKIKLLAVDAEDAQAYCYFSRSARQDEMMRRIEELHRTDLVRISNMIHWKAASPVREFARAFQIKKEQDR